MNKYMAIDASTHKIEAEGETKKEVIDSLADSLKDTKGTFKIVEVVDTLSITTKQVIETTMINSEGKEVKIDARDRVIPTERTRTPGALEPQVQEILDNAG